MNVRDLTSLALPAALPSSVLAEPLVDGVSGGVLDPDIHPDGTVARVPAGVTQAGDTVHIFWEGATAYTDWIPVSAGTAGKELPFDIARSFIDENRNRQVAVHYDVERGGQRLTSAVLRFGVGVVRLLPAPDVPDAVDGVFDPTGITGGVVTVAPAEADLEPGDEVTMHVDGPNSSNMIVRAVLGSRSPSSFPWRRSPPISTTTSMSITSCIDLSMGGMIHRRCERFVSRHSG